jgi:hypothetical protein
MTILVTSLINEAQTLDSVAIPAFGSKVFPGSSTSHSSAIATALAAKDVQVVDITYRGGELVSAAKTLTASDDGQVYFLDSATEFAITLPTPTLGLMFEFIVKSAPSGADYTVVTASGANIIKGHVLTSDVNSATDGDLETSGGDTISFVQAKAVAGDRVVLRCDGTNWFAYAQCSVFDAITITTAA